MNTEPFELIDRFKPGGDNDEQEIAKLESALDGAMNQPRRDRQIGHIDQRETRQRVETYQAANGLKVDGLVRPKGPTAQKLAADTSAREIQPTYRGMIGRGANLPLYGSVGKGQGNLSPDTRMMTAGLKLTDSKPKRQPKPLELEARIRSFQRQHGLKDDGIIEPFGPTHERMNHLLGPRLDKLIGPDPELPRPFEAQKPQMIGRTLTFRPTTIRTRWQEPESMDDASDWQAAKTLADGITEELQEVRRYEIAQKAERIEGGAGDDRLSGGARDDLLKADAPEVEKKDDTREKYLERYGKGDQAKPWHRGQDETDDEFVGRLKSAIHHSTDSETRKQIVEAARASLPKDPSTRLAAEQGVSGKAWLSAEEAPREAQAIYREWLAKPADRRAPLPDTFEMVYFAGPDGRLYLRKGAETDPVSLSNIRRVEGLAEEVQRRDSKTPDSYQVLFDTAAQAQMEEQRSFGSATNRASDLSGMNLPAALGRRSRLERFHRHGPDLDRRAAERQQINHAKGWIAGVIDRLKKEPGQTRKEGVRVGHFSTTVENYLRNKGVEPETGTLDLPDTQIQHALRDAKVKAGKAISESDMISVPEHIRRPDAVLWQESTGVERPTVLFIFSPKEDSKKGKIVIRVNVNSKLDGEKRTRNLVTTSGRVDLSDLRDANMYDVISGELR